MTRAQAHEIERLNAQIARLERELSLRADAVSALADELATTRGELDDAVALGTEYATALRFACPDSPALLTQSASEAPSVASKATEG